MKPDTNEDVAAFLTVTIVIMGTIIGMMAYAFGIEAVIAIAAAGIVIFFVWLVVWSFWRVFFRRGKQ